jgi:hypothetical protein
MPQLVRKNLGDAQRLLDKLHGSSCKYQIDSRGSPEL